jgi:hypothetical protein
VLDYSKFENHTGQDVHLNLEPFHISAGIKTVRVWHVRSRVCVRCSIYSTCMRTWRMYVSRCSPQYRTVQYMRSSECYLYACRIAPVCICTWHVSVRACVLCVNSMHHQMCTCEYCMHIPTSERNEVLHASVYICVYTHTHIYKSVHTHTCSNMDTCIYV